VRARLNDLVNRIIQSSGHTATQIHVSDGTLVPCVPGGGELDIGNSELGGLLGDPQNTANGISHSATSVRTQDLDSDGVGSLSNPIFAGTSAVGVMAIAILVDVVLRDGGSPEARPPNLVQLVLILVSMTYMSTPLPPAE
jgi:hypothetical protein